MIRLTLAVPVAAVLLSACATQQPPKPQYIVPKGSEMASNMFGYSQAVRTGPWVIVSGQVGYDPKTGGFPKSFDAQVDAAFHNLTAVLKDSGASLDDVVEITTYQLDMSRFQDVLEARNETFGTHRPAWNALGVKALALPGIQFEVSAMAYAPKKAKKVQ